MSIKVLDVSNYQPIVDWSAVKSHGIEAAYAKATEGITWSDPTFKSHVQGAQAVGIAMGAYHFAHPESNDPIAEAKHFVSALQQVPTDLMPVLDLESPTSTGTMTGAQLTAWAKAFCDYVQTQTRRKVMIYTGVWFITRFNLSGLGDYPLWISDYGVTSVPQCGDWTSYLMWQYTDAAAGVSGMPGQVDMSYAPSVEALKGNYTEGDLQPMSKPTLQLKSTGAAVKALQQDLVSLGLGSIVGTPDGDFGPNTLLGVKAFQSAHGLATDGVVGPATWGALDKAIADLKPAAEVKPVTPAPQSRPNPVTALTGPSPDDIQKALALLEQGNELVAQAMQILKG